MKNDVLVYQAVYPDDLTENQVNETKAVLSNMPNYIRTVNEFALSTAAELLGSEQGNEIFSPISLYFAMAILTSGAEGNTLEELLDVMHGSSVDQINQNAHAMYNALYINNEKSKCQIANSLWLDKTLTFAEQYLNYAKNLYSSLYSVDYTDDNTAKLQNKWITENTNSVLDVSERTVPKDTVLTILNTVYFKSAFYDNFDERATAVGKFELADGSEVDVDYMKKYFYSDGEFTDGEKYLRTSHNLYFKDDSKAIFILPKDGYTVDDLIKSQDTLQECFYGGEDLYGELTYEIPKFTAKSEYGIVDAMKALGVHDAFCESANFSNMMSNSEGVMVSDISQQASFEIDEYGVEAAAFTEIRMVRTSMPMPPENKCEMIFNKPFLYGIEKNGILMFLGVCNNPKEM